MARKAKRHDPNGTSPLQLGFFTPDCDWTPPALSDLPSWKGAKLIAIDAETRDPSIGNKMGSGSLRDGYTVGWGFAIDGGPKHYLPFRHEGGDNLPVEGVLGYLREQIKHFDGEFTGANLSYDIDYGYSDGFEWNPEAIFRDVQIADPLLYELHYRYSLSEIGKRWGVDAKDESVLKKAAQSYGLDPKKGLWRLPGRYVGEYAEQDVASPIDIIKQQTKRIDNEGLRQIYDMESKLIPVLVRMRRRGIRIDFDKLDEIEAWTVREEHDNLALVKRETGIDIGFDNIWKPDAIAPALEDIGMSLSKTSAGAPQIDAELLKGHDHPVASAILRIRKVNKLRNTFAGSIRRYAIGDRIHCGFNQITGEDASGEQKGVRYGRISVGHPGLQQQPSPDRDPEIAGEWRKIFVAEEGAIWGCNDYSQQEPRWTTHFAAELDLPKARLAAQKYCDDHSLDNHDMMTRLIHTDTTVDQWFSKDPKGVYKVMRGRSKNIFLGLCYGEGGPKLSRDIGLPTRWAHIYGWGRERTTIFFDDREDAMESRADLQKGFIKEFAGEEAQEVLDNFDEQVPYVRLLANTASTAADKRGYVRTIMGRRLHFKQRDDMSFESTHKALNRVIQGSAADQTKQALIDIDRAGHYLQLQVHDETNGSYGSNEEAKAVGDIMRYSVEQYCEPRVPFLVDTEVGPSWGEIKGI